MQQASDKQVAASPWSAAVLERGTSGPDDPQYGVLLPYPPVKNVRTFADGDTLRVGPLALVAQFTGGHTPGGTTWSWRSCEAARRLDMVDADSQTPVSADGFSFTRSTTYPGAIADFEHGFVVLGSLPCDVLITPQILTNLLANAVKFTPPGGDLTLESAAGKGSRFTLWLPAAERAEAP